MQRITMALAALLLAAGAQAQPTLGGGGGLQAGGPYQAYYSGSYHALATPGAEMAPTIVAANWTCGAGWDCSVAGTLNKNVDGTGTAVPNPALTLTAGITYKVSITTTVTVGNISVYMGGITAVTIGASGSYDYYWTLPANTPNLTIGPGATAARFTITSISVKALSGGGLEVQGPFQARGTVSIDGPLRVIAGTTAAGYRAIEFGATGWGIYADASGPTFRGPAGNALSITTGGVTTVLSTGGLQLGSGGIISGPSANVMQMGANAATASAQTFKAPDSTGNAAAGGNLTMRGGAGTGTGNPIGGNLILGGGAPNGTGERGVVLIEDGGTKPTCAVGIRGAIWYDAAAGGAADTIEICAKSAADAYAWVAFATPIP